MYPNQKFNSIQLLGAGGVLAVLLGHLFSYLRLTIPFFGTKGLGLLTNIKALGEISGFFYVILLLGVAVLCYSAYIVFKEKRGYLRAAYASAGFFIVLLIYFFVLKGQMRSAMGDSGFDFDSLTSSFLTQAVKLGIGSYLFLIAAVLFYFADRECKKCMKSE